MAQLEKNPPTMQETWVRFLGWEDPLEKGKATYSSILAWRIPWRSPWGCRVRHDLMTWASLVAQMVTNQLAIQETWVQSLGWEDPLEKGKAIHFSILA